MLEQIVGAVILFGICFGIVVAVSYIIQFYVEH